MSILLLYFLYCSLHQNKVLPSLSKRHSICLNNLNWVARRQAIFVSLGNNSNKPNANAITIKKKLSYRDIVAPYKYNILGQLRVIGQIECLQHCISYI